MSVLSLSIDLIDPRQDGRALDERAVEAIAASMREVGQISPVRVREKADGRFELIAGGHRTAACRLLGRPFVNCDVVKDDDLRAELSMIDENLCRAELSASDRARQTARRKGIYLQLHPETAAQVAGAHASNRAQGNAAEKFSAASFAADTAAKTGQTDRSVRLHAERGAKVIEEAHDAIRGTHLDTGAYLDKLKRLPPEHQAETVRIDLAAPRPAHRVASPPVSSAARLIADLLSLADLAGVEPGDARAAAAKLIAHAESIDPPGTDVVAEPAGLLMLEPVSPVTRTRSSRTHKAEVAAIEREFDREFWPQVPKKVGKAEALKAFAKARKDTPSDVIVAGLLRYAASRAGEDPQFTKSPAAWLNGRRWEDEAVQSSPPKPRDRAQERTAEMRRGMMSYLDEECADDR